MDLSARICGAGAMTMGGIMQAAALVIIALAGEPFPMASFLIGAGVLVFLVGAVVCDQRTDHSFQDHRLPTYPHDH
jgi:hypothetical protein